MDVSGPVAAALTVALKHNPSCDSLHQREGYPHRRCSCGLQKMTEAEKAKDLQATRKEYLRTHTGSPAAAEEGSWVAVYRKAATLVNI